jgi:hypothetical protein
MRPGSANAVLTRETSQVTGPREIALLLREMRRADHQRKAHRRIQCATAIDIPAMAQLGVAPSVTANSTSSGTTAAEPLSAQGSARTASSPVVRVTADSYVSCTPLATSHACSRLVRHGPEGDFAKLGILKEMAL